MSKADAESVLQTSLDAGTLDTTLEILGTISDECKLHLGKNGLSTALVDPANVMMHDLSLSKSAFRETPSGSFTVGTNMESLGDYTAKAGDGQTVDFSFIPKTRKLEIKYNGYDITLACIDPDSIRQEPDVPDMDLPNQFTVETSALKDRLETCEIASNHVAIECDPDADEVHIIGEGDTDDVRTTLTTDDMIRHNIREETRSMYSIGYLVKHTGTNSANAQLLNNIPSDEISVMVGQEFPIWFDYEYAGGHGEVRTMLAPRIEN